MEITRKERYLKSAIDKEPIADQEIRRIEFFLSAIAGKDVNVPDLMSTSPRVEFYLAAIAGQDVVLPEPVTNVDYYLAKIAGMNIAVLPSPVTRLEHLLSDWAEASAGELKTVSGSVISIADALAKAVDDLSVSIEPVQDLHGYDKPWVGGAGKNLIDPNDSNLPYTSGGVTISKSGNGYKVVASGATGYPFVAIGTVHGLKAGAYIASINTTSNAIGIRIIDRSVTPPITINSGNYGFTLSEDIDHDVLVELTITGDALVDGTYDNVLLQLEKGSTASAWTPYENICPISGHSAVNVTRTGDNLLPLDKRTDSAHNVYYYRTGDEGVLLKKGVTYTLACPTEFTKPGGLYITSKATGTDIAVKYGAYVLRHTPTEDVLCAFSVYWLNVPSEGTSNINLVLNVGETNPTAYTPYVGDEYTVEFPALGVNQWDEQWESGTFDTSTGANINAGSANNQIRSKNLIPVKGGQTYYFHVTTRTGVTGRGLWTALYDANLNMVQAVAPSDMYATNGKCICIGQYDTAKLFTMPQEVAYIKFYCQGSYGTTYQNDISINYPSTATTYEPYSDTVYGGTLDVTTGELVVNRAYLSLNTANMDNTEDYPAWRNSGVRNIVGGDLNTKIDALTNVSPIAMGSVWAIGANTRNAGDTLIMNKAYFNMTQSDWQALAMDIQFSILLAEPQTIQLTPTEITMLLGNNTLWADAGDSTLRYWAEAE